MAKFYFEPVNGLGTEGIRQALRDSKIFIKSQEVGSLKTMDDSNDQERQPALLQNRQIHFGHKFAR